MALNLDDRLGARDSPTPFSDVYNRRGRHPLGSRRSRLKPISTVIEKTNFKPEKTAAMKVPKIRSSARIIHISNSKLSSFDPASPRARQLGL
jgi:hypothetical protein